MVRRATRLALALLLAASACHCDDECRSAAQCPSGVCRDGRCQLPVGPDDGGADAASADGG